MIKLSTGTWLWSPEVKVLDPRSHVGFPGGYVAPRSRTKAPGSRRALRVKLCIPRAGRGVNRGVTNFVRVGMESLQVIYDFLEQCDSSAAHTFLESALEDLTTFKVDGYSRRSGRQPSPAG